MVVKPNESTTFSGFDSTRGLYIDGGVLIPGDITGDKAGDNEFGCSTLDGVLDFDNATASTNFAWSSCKFSGC